MAKVLIKVNVAYCSRFIKTFDSQSDVRQKNGEQKYSRGVDKDIHNFIYVICDWESVQSAEKFWSTNEATDQIKQWNSVISPEIKILRENPHD